jgi:hypothetical protein
VGLGEGSGRTVLLARIATKLNADKTRFDPRPVGVLLTFRFRNCSRPLPVRYERTPSVPGCQYPFPEFLQTALRWLVIILIFVIPNARLIRSLIRLAVWLSPCSRLDIQAIRSDQGTGLFRSTVDPRGGSSNGDGENAPEGRVVYPDGNLSSSWPKPDWWVGDSRLSPGLTLGLRRYSPSGGAARQVRPKLNADSLDLRPNHRRSAGFPLQGLLPSASGLQ